MWDNNKAKEAASLSFSLLEMASGPIHYDFEIKKSKVFVGKLAFDVRISQKVDFEVQIQSLSCQLKESLTLVNYFYNYVLTVLSQGQ